MNSVFKILCGGLSIYRPIYKLVPRKKLTIPTILFLKVFGQDSMIYLGPDMIPTDQQFAAKGKLFYGVFYSFDERDLIGIQMLETQLKNEQDERLYGTSETL